MKLILKEDVPNLGKAGDLVEVARGYGRNFLVPQGKALDATAHHLREVEEQKRLIIKKKTKDLEAAQKLAEQVSLPGADPFPEGFRGGKNIRFGDLQRLGRSPGQGPDSL